ncbi:MAG: hypothetical protein Fur0037_04510 [Planctomycetota bacterium]
MRIPALGTALALLFACGAGPPRLSPRDARVPPWAGAFGVPVVGGRLPEAAEAFVDPDLPGSALILVEGWRVVDANLTEAQRLGLSSFVHNGGRLLLLGYAASLAREIGVEPLAPDVREPFRWGFDATTASGRCELGFTLVSGRAEDLVEGLAHDEAGEWVFRFAGGRGVLAQQCLWSRSDPREGEVLGRLSVERDGRLEVQPAAVLARWTFGSGAILACGLVPDPESADPVLAGNAARFLHNAVRWLGGGAMPRALALWHLDPAPVPAEPEPMPPLSRRELPAAPLIAHWGYEVSTRSVGPGRAVDEDLLPSWGAGADWISIDLSAPGGELPFFWRDRDPIRRPTGYRQPARPGEWSRPLEIAEEAHARSMLAHLELPSLPVRDGTVAEQLAALRFLGREVFDRRTAADAAFDGLGLKRWFDDGMGYGLAMLQDYGPGAALVQVGQDGRPAGAVTALDAADGRPLGLWSCGVSRRWRNGFPADLFPAGRLDCRARPSVGDPDPGGGSDGDWIAIQVNDFVRARLGRSPAFWWRGAADASPLVRAYVDGLSQDPLRAAVAARCTSTGLSGWREAEKGLLEDPQPGFGCEIPVPSTTLFLQNNHLRLHGSGGSLFWDPKGLADFDEENAVLLSREFVRTRLLGGRPSGEERRAVDLDLFALGEAFEGGCDASVRVGKDRAALPPRVLASAQVPRRPRTLRWDVHVAPGYYELDARLRAVEGDSIVVFGLEGEDLRSVAVREGAQAVDVLLPLHLSREGQRTIEVECRRGGAVRVERARLRRMGDVSVESRVGTPAGAMASIEEITESTHYGERAILSTAGDFSGFLFRAECTHAVQNLQVERRFSFAHHFRLKRSGSGDPARGLRHPFVLSSDRPGVPDLVVVPLALSRYQSFSVSDEGLVLRGAAEPFHTTVVGFLLDENGEGRALGSVREVFSALDRPDEIDLSAGEAVLKSDAPFAWTRVLRIRQPARTPCLVRERGYWTWRGTTRGQNGEHLLRIVHVPGDEVRAVGGPSVLARTRPGRGSAHLVAMRDPGPSSVEVRVLRQSPFATPSVVMAAEFDEAFLDGKPWSYHDGRSVFLPKEPGTHRVETRSSGGARPPHLLATSARIQSCRWDPERKELVFLAAPKPGRPPELPFTALVDGGSPRSVDGGELIPEAEFRRHEAPGSPRPGAAVIRFRPGLVRVRYGS